MNKNAWVVYSKRVPEALMKENFDIKYQGHFQSVFMSRRKALALAKKLKTPRNRVQVQNMTIGEEAKEYPKPDRRMR